MALTRTPWLPMSAVGHWQMPRSQNLPNPGSQVKSQGTKGHFQARGYRLKSGRGFAGARGGRLLWHWAPGANGRFQPGIGQLHGWAPGAVGVGAIGYRGHWWPLGAVHSGGERGPGAQSVTARENSAWPPRGVPLGHTGGPRGGQRKISGFSHSQTGVRQGKGGPPRESQKVRHWDTIGGGSNSPWAGRKIVGKNCGPGPVLGPKGNTQVGPLWGLNRNSSPFGPPKGGEE